MLELYGKIKDRRIELGMTQEELAQKTGYSGKSMIAKVENGKVDLPQSKIIVFAKALETTPAYLMGWVDNPDPDYVPTLGDHFKRSAKGIFQSVVDIPAPFKEFEDLEEDQKHYENDDTAAIAQELLENPDLRLLFDAAKDSKPEDLKMAAEMLKRFKGTNPDG